MQSHSPQLRSTGNPFEHQIIYLSDSSPPASDSSSDEVSTPLSDKEDSVALDSTSNKHMVLRATTAPARPLNEVAEFRRTSNFLLLEHTVFCTGKMLQKADLKYELDSEEGQGACKRLLNQIERLIEVFKVPASPRDYRAKFSRAYRILYHEGSLSYLTEILDSAQEGFPYIYVNGEKYVFSSEVLETGSSLHCAFSSLQELLSALYEQLNNEEFTGPLSPVLSEMARGLSEFDCTWAEFERMYVQELMLIEADARRFIIEAIQLERTLTSIECSFQAKGELVTYSDRYNYTRGLLVALIGKLNAIANVEGNGRDDLTARILLEAEALGRCMSSLQSPCVRKLSEDIKRSLWALRALLKKYGENIEVVDPQLKNNPELVEGLMCFESSWEKGKRFFLNSQRYRQLVYFSGLLRELSDSYRTFKELVECSDSELFLSIPGVLILRSLQDQDAGICQYFCPELFRASGQLGTLYKGAKRSFALGKLACGNEREYIEVLEMKILGLSIPGTYRSQVIQHEFDNIDHTVLKVKTLASSLHRFRPLDWNKFLDVALSAN